MLTIFHNELDAKDFQRRDYDNLLTEWMAAREQYPQARLYKDTICVQNDVTPKTRDDAWALNDATGDYQILCHAGEPNTIAIAAALLSVGTAVYSYISMANMEQPAEVKGSPNNSLAERQNKFRVMERVADNYGTRPLTPDLIAPVWRHYVDNIQTEECLLTCGTGWFAFDEDEIFEGDTPVNKIEGASISIHEPNQSTISENPQIQIGAEFTEPQIVAKKVSAIDGRQTLKPPNSEYASYQKVRIEPEGFTVDSFQGEGVKSVWNVDYFTHTLFERNADFTRIFGVGDKVIIRGATVADDDDLLLTSNARVNQDGTILIYTDQVIDDLEQFERLNISAFLITDNQNGDIVIDNNDGSQDSHTVVTSAQSMDLAGNYSIDSMQRVNDGYVFTLNNPSSVNINFDNLATAYTAPIAASLTNKTNVISLDGKYIIASVDALSMTLVNPSTENSNWDLVQDFSQAQLDSLLSADVEFAGEKDNYIGWYYCGSQNSTGFLLNFLATNGIYEGDDGKEVAIQVEYQMVENNEPVGDIYLIGDVMRGKGNDRSSIGLTMRHNLPSAGAFRFRAKRANDNGNEPNLIDDVVFESAYSFYPTTKLVYEYDTIIRLQRKAIGSGTNAAELKLIGTRKLDTPNGFLPTSNMADIVRAMALDPFIGRMQPDEVDSDDLYNVSNQIAAHFGTPKAAEFNYTFDDKFASYQEMVFMLAEAVFCTARRENGMHYLTFEAPTPNSLILFNHRNVKPESMTISEMFGIQDNYDGVELKWRNPDDNFAEAIIKLPNDYQTNYKTIDTKGVTNYAQAWFLANRIWNKLKHNRKAIEVTVYGEGNLVTRKDRIAIVDSTVPILCSGEIMLQENTVLTLGYPFELDNTKAYVIHLQLKNGTVEVIDIINQLSEYEIEIAHIPMMPLVTSGITHAVFNITEASSVDSDAYLIEEKDSHGLFESQISASSYDERYYKNDYDLINGLISL